MSGVAGGLPVLDLFSAAAGGWSLGMHRAGFTTVAACEAVEWRRTLYAENNPGVLLYDDVRTLTAARLVSDLGHLPAVVVGSPPCQDISSANPRGKGVEGERSGLFFEAVRIIGEVRPRWFALENSANLRTRGADAVLDALEALGYACWPFVVRASDIGANHERPRSWLIGCDLAQVADADGFGRDEGWGRRRLGLDVSVPASSRRNAIGPGHVCRHGIRWPWACDECDREASDAEGERRYPWPGLEGQAGGHEPPNLSPHAHGEGQPAPSGHGEMAVLRRLGADRESRQADDADSTQVGPEGLIGREERRQGEVAQRADISARPEMDLCEADRLAALQHRADWSLDDLARHIRLDDGLSAWLAQQRIAVGGPRGTTAASLIVEAFGDAVVPQIPEAIGRAIVRVEEAMAAVCARRGARTASLPTGEGAAPVR